MRLQTFVVGFCIAAAASKSPAETLSDDDPLLQVDKSFVSAEEIALLKSAGSQMG